MIMYSKLQIWFLKENTHQSIHICLQKTASWNIPGLIFRFGVSFPLFMSGFSTVFYGISNKSSEQLDLPGWSCTTWTTIGSGTHFQWRVFLVFLSGRPRWKHFVAVGGCFIPRKMNSLTSWKKTSLSCLNKRYLFKCLGFFPLSRQFFWGVGCSYQSFEACFRGDVMCKTPKKRRTSTS